MLYVRRNQKDSLLKGLTFYSDILPSMRQTGSEMRAHHGDVESDTETRGAFFPCSHPSWPISDLGKSDQNEQRLFSVRKDYKTLHHFP